MATGTDPHHTVTMVSALKHAQSSFASEKLPKFFLYLRSIYESKAKLSLGWSMISLTPFSVKQQLIIVAAM